MQILTIDPSLNTTSTSFAIGRRWYVDRLLLSDHVGSCRDASFTFVIIGEPVAYEGMPASYMKNHVRCRLEVDNHTQKCNARCSHGDEQDYPHRHLRKFATLQEIP